MDFRDAGIIFARYLRENIKETKREKELQELRDLLLKRSQPLVPANQGVAQRDPNICNRAIINGQPHDLTWDEYHALLRRKSEFAIFVDGVSMSVSKREKGGRKKADTAKLTGAEFNLLLDFIVSGLKMRPGATPSGRHLQTAHRVFASARRKADYSISRYETRFFKTHRRSDVEGRAAYQFCPASNLDYCIIMPLEDAPEK